MFICLIDLQLILISVEYSFFLYVSTLRLSTLLKSHQDSILSSFPFKLGNFILRKAEVNLNTRKLKCTMDISVEANPCNSYSGVNLPFHFSLVLL